MFAAAASRLGERLQAVQAGQHLVVARRDLPAALDELLHPAQVHQPGDRVLLAHPPRVAEPHMVVGGKRALALVAVDPRFVGQQVRRGDEHPALPTGDHLGGV